MRECDKGVKAIKERRAAEERQYKKVVLVEFQEAFPFGIIISNKRIARQ
jgi:hypothetical protein